MENKNEHEHIKEKYVERFGLYGVLGNDIDDKTIELVIANAHHFERPDICSVVENKVYGIEHFEFGPYIQKRNGSDYEIKHAGFKRELRNELAKTKSSVNKVGNLGVNASLLEYKENFLKNTINIIQK